MVGLNPHCNALMSASVLITEQNETA